MTPEEIEAVTTGAFVGLGYDATEGCLLFSVGSPVMRHVPVRMAALRTAIAQGEALARHWREVETRMPEVHWPPHRVGRCASEHRSVLYYAHWDDPTCPVCQGQAVTDEAHTTLAALTQAAEKYETLGPLVGDPDDRPFTPQGPTTGDQRALQAALAQARRVLAP